MSMPYNFGVNELPGEGCRVKTLDLTDVGSEIDFDMICRNHEIDVKIDAEFDPSVSRKVDVLCENYDVEHLASAISELEWSEVSAKRTCYGELLKFRSCGETIETEEADVARRLEECKSRLESIIMQLTVLRLAHERVEKREPNENGGGLK